MADAAMLLVEVLRQLRASVDAMAQEQAMARASAFSDEMAQALVSEMADVRKAIERLATQQTAFQRDVVGLLEDIRREVWRLPDPIETLSEMAQDVALIADRYRPSEEYAPFASD